MESKELGKITSVNFGMVKDYPFLFGLQLRFSIGYCASVGDGGTHTVNISKECRWEESERQSAIAKAIEETYQILKDAKVSYVPELVGKPVEVTTENNTYKNFRILTEVL